MLIKTEPPRRSCGDCPRSSPAYNAAQPMPDQPRKQYEQLRSYRWLGPDDLRSFGHRSRAKQMGYSREDWEGKPVIGILNTWSDLNTCHTHFRERAQEVKRGVWQAGGFPVEIPVMSLSEMFMKPSAMMFRNKIGRASCRARDEQHLGVQHY